MVGREVLPEGPFFTSGHVTLPKVQKTFGPLQLGELSDGSKFNDIICHYNEQ